MDKIIHIYTKSEVIDGFTVKPGFAAWLEDDGTVRFSSGWTSNHAIFVYRKTKDGGEWVGEWDYTMYEPVTDAIMEYKIDRLVPLRDYMVSNGHILETRTRIEDEESGRVYLSTDEPGIYIWWLINTPDIWDVEVL